MQTDPIGYGDGPNWYNYVGSDPVNGRDPTGLLNVCLKTGGSPGTALNDYTVTLLYICQEIDFSDRSGERGNESGGRGGEPKEKPQSGQALPAFCGTPFYSAGVFLADAGQATMNIGTTTMAVGGVLAAIGTPVGGIGAGPGLGVARVGATIFERGALEASAGAFLKAFSGDTSAIPTLVSDVFGAFSGKFAGLSSLGNAVVGSSAGIVNSMASKPAAKRSPC